MSNNESIKLPEGYKVVNTLPEVHQMVVELTNQFTVDYALPVSQEYPAHSQFPCVAKVYLDAEHCVRIEYFPLSLYKEVMEFKEQSKSLAGIKNAAPRATELGIHDIHRSLPETNKDEVVGYCILMQADHTATSTRQFYGRGSIISIVNRAYERIAIFSRSDKQHEWHIVNAIPITESDLEEFATLSHISDA